MSKAVKFRNLIQEVVKQAPQGCACSPEDLAKFYQATRPDLLGIADFLLRTAPQLRGRVDPEDLVQNVWESISGEYQRKGGSLDDFGPWLARKLRQRFLDEYRKAHSQKRNVALESPLQGYGSDNSAAGPRDLVAPNTSASAVAVRNERQLRISSILEELKRSPSKKDRLCGQIVYLRHYAVPMALTNNQVADQLRISVSKASILYRKGLAEVKRRLLEQSGVPNPGSP